MLRIWTADVLQMNYGPETSEGVLQMMVLIHQKYCYLKLRRYWYFAWTNTFLDIFKMGIWIENKKNLHQELFWYCITSKADNTAKQWRYAWNTFCKWCNSWNPVFTPLPVLETNVALFIIHFAKQYKSSGKIHSAVQDISWPHSLAGHVDPRDSDLVKIVRFHIQEQGRSYWTPLKNLVKTSKNLMYHCFIAIAPSFHRHLFIA